MTLLCIIFAVFLVTAVFSMADMGAVSYTHLDVYKRQYQYRIAVPGTVNVFERKYLWKYPKTLDIEKMNKAASFCLCLLYTSKQMP